MSAYVAHLVYPFISLLGSEYNILFFYLSTLRIVKKPLLYLTKSCAGKVAHWLRMPAHCLRNVVEITHSFFGGRTMVPVPRCMVNEQIKSLFNTFLFESLSQHSGEYMDG